MDALPKIQSNPTQGPQQGESTPKRVQGYWRVGVFVDAQNIYMSVKAAFGDGKINYRALRDFVTREGTITKVTVFTFYDQNNEGQVGFLNALALMGYRVVTKPLKQLPDGTYKANMDMEMAIEVLSSAPYLDEVLLVTGDGDFVPLVDQLTRMGKIVNVIGPDKYSSPELIRACDTFTHLTQIPGIFAV